MKISKEMVPELTKLQKRYKTTGLAYLGINDKANINNAYARFLNGFTDQYGRAAGWAGISGAKVIFINKDKHNDINKWLQEVNEGIRPQHWIIGETNMSDRVVEWKGKPQLVNFKAGDRANALRTVYHEFAHVIDFTYNLSENPDIVRLFKLQNKTIRKVGFEKANAISGYSTYNEREFIAEAFTDVMVSKNPRQISIDVVNIIKQKIN